MRSMLLGVLLMACTSSYAATIYQVVDTQSTSIEVSGVTNFVFGAGPTNSFNVLSPSILGLPNGTILGTPEFRLTVNSVELAIDYLFEQDVSVSATLSPTVRVTPAVIDMGPASDLPFASVDGRFIRNVTPTVTTGSDCTGPFSNCYALTGTNLDSEDFSSLTILLFDNYGKTVTASGGESISDFSDLAGSSITFGALGFDGVFSVNNVPVTGNFIPLFKFDYSLTYQQPYLAPVVVPIPATLPLFIGGLLSLGLAVRHRGKPGHVTFK